MIPALGFRVGTVVAALGFSVAMVGAAAPATFAADAPIAVLSYRIVPLACNAAGLSISGGGVLRVSPAGSCADVVPGRAITVTLDDQTRVVPGKLDPASRPASELPAAAFSFSPSSAAAPETKEVTVTIIVAIPPSTPAGSDIYLSTERSSYNPAEIRMDQLDARRYRLQLPLEDGGRLAFRVTRGSFNTIERDAKGRLPPPHIAIGAPNATYTITVEAWSDDN
jgi:hypothetical protein